MAPTNEPTNAEILTLLQQHMSTSATANREQAAASATLQSELREVRGSLTAQGVKILEIDRRLTKTELEAKRLRDSHADLEGDLLREVGALAANDQKQNVKLADIERETKSQSATLASHSATLADVASEVQPLKAIRKYAKWSWVAILAAPKLWEFLELVWNHIKL